MGKPLELPPEGRQALDETIINRYRQGASLRTIATETGHSYGLVHRTLEDAGIPRRPRGGGNRKR